MKQEINEKMGLNEGGRDKSRTTIALQKVTKGRLDDSKAPGQCYDGFISELVEYWERYRIGSSLCGPGRPVRRDVGRKSL